MIHTFIGNLGHLLIIISFISSLVATYAYVQVTRQTDPFRLQQWRQNARVAFFIHVLAVLGVIVSLFAIIYNNYYEYHYAWSHSSRNLPAYYMVSSFWEGQEGSFLLWIFWQALLGIFLIATNKKWEAPVMAVFALVQAFLASMILGVVIGELKIGSSPFILLRDAVDAPIFQTNPDFVPEDGTGLNPLLQNYWMVIHPPTLFLGFALTLVPFAYLIAGLWQRKYTEWVRPALPWTVFSAAILGIGIMMGAIWAYETLNFGGYWNWDPVENAVYIPWLILVAGLHTMVLFRKNKSGLKTTVVLIIAAFILILYSTFLTRSGILGESSVHSFTDLGLSGQLLIYLLAFLLLSVLLAAIRWKEIPTTEKELSVYSSDFWVFLGVTVLALMGFQVLLPTSFPVINSILNNVGIESNMAPPADQVLFYTKFQLWFAIGLAILSGTGQFFWWKKMHTKNLWEQLNVPIVITLIISILVVILARITTIQYILLLTAAIYSIVANGKFILQFFRNQASTKLSGGSIAHMGVALMLLGILFSSGYSTIISENTSGKLYSREFSEEMNQNNVLLWLNEPINMNKYELKYTGQKIEARGVPGLIDKEKVFGLEDPYKALALDTITRKNKVYYMPGDTLRVYPENTYYEVVFKNQVNQKKFHLYPRAQVNPNMGLIASPDIKIDLHQDLYTHVSSIPDPEQPVEWSEMEEHKIKAGDNFFVKDYIVQLAGVQRVADLSNIQLDTGDVAVKAVLQVLGKDQNFTAEPIYLIKDRMVGRIPDQVSDLGFKFTFLNVHPETNDFTVGVETTQRDYIILKAMEKPMINLLWTGTLLLVFGFGISSYRRYQDFRNQRNKGLEV
ncbi:MAG: cytochrome c biogenesis protein CcsA [Candidatus Cyclobacteriaceae bacterium M3_2C_046]